ncbi:MAG: DNA cytosine methyltransferase, partial [Pirellulales bacterium]
MTLRDSAPTVLDLFSGIGGFSLAFERHGFRTVAFSELEPFCVRVLAQHWPDVPNLGDVRGIDGADVVRRFGAVDVLVGGFPCQDISFAGKGAGIEGARSGLWFEMLRLVREVRPAWLLAENVPALRTRGADTVLAGLEAAGYTCRPFVVGAWAVGAPHRRERVWIVAHAEGIGRQSEGSWRFGSEQGTDATGSGLADTNSERGGAFWPSHCQSFGADGVGGSSESELGHTDEARCGRSVAKPYEGRTRPSDGRAAGLAHAASERLEGGRNGSTGFEAKTKRFLFAGSDQRHRWPAGYGCEQHAWEPPRVVEGPPESRLGQLSYGVPGELAGFPSGVVSYGQTTDSSQRKGVRLLWYPHETEALQRNTGIPNSLRTSSILQPRVFQLGLSARKAIISGLKEAGGSRDSARAIVSFLRVTEATPTTSHGHESSQQFIDQCEYALRALPYTVALGTRESRQLQAAFSKVRRDRL